MVTMVPKMQSPASQLSILSKPSTSYFWPKMRQGIERHLSYCLRCQQRNKSTNKRTSLAPLPILKCPNLWIHANLFGPMITADSNKKIVLCITDAFMLWSLRLPAKTLKWWLTQFTEIGSPNLEFQPRFISTEARNLSISSRRSFSNS
jgi:hypothetical protein